MVNALDDCQHLLLLGITVCVLCRLLLPSHRSQPVTRVGGWLCLLCIAFHLTHGWWQDPRPLEIRTRLPGPGSRPDAAWIFSRRPIRQRAPGGKRQAGRGPAVGPIPAHRGGRRLWLVEPSPAEGSSRSRLPAGSRCGGSSGHRGWSMPPTHQGSTRPNVRT